MSHRLPPGQFPQPGSYLRRGRDGMIGLVRGGVRQIERAPGLTVRDVPIWWIDEPGRAYLAAERGDYDVLDPVEAAAARAEFATIVCGACGGRGSTREAVCPEPRCVDGRLLGVRDAFDAAVAARSNQPKRVRTDTEFLASREMELRFDTKCEVCGKQLAAGTRARGGKSHGRWGFQCLAHKPAS